MQLALELVLACRFRVQARSRVPIAVSREPLAVSRPLSAASGPLLTIGVSTTGPSAAGCPAHPPALARPPHLGFGLTGKHRLNERPDSGDHFAQRCT